MAYRFVGYDAQQRRRDQRRTYPVLHVRADDRDYESVDWSLGGVLLKDPGGTFQMGRRARIRSIRRLSDTVPTSVDIVVRVVRVEAASHRTALAFERLDDRAYRFLEDCLVRPRRDRQAHGEERSGHKVGCG